MSALHGTLGWLTVALAVGLMAVAFAAPRMRPGRAARAVRLLVDGLVAAATITTFLALVVGGLLLASGFRPALGGAHIALAVAALASLPVTLAAGWLIEGDRWPERRSRWSAIGAAVLAVLAFLLVQTG